MASATSTIPPGSEACWIIGIIFSLSRSEEHTSELQSQSNLVCRLLLEKKKKNVEVLATEPIVAPLEHQELLHSHFRIYDPIAPTSCYFNVLFRFFNLHNA